MEMITDPVRLKAGDLITIPSEVGKRRRLHLAVESYGKHGISVGFTGRSYNSAETVKRQLTVDDGRPRTFYVTSVERKYTRYDGTDKYDLLLGGGRDLAKPDVPEVRLVTLAELPHAGMPGEWECTLRWARHNKPAVCAALSGHVLGRHITEQWARSNRDFADDAMNDVFDSTASQIGDDFIGSYHGYLPAFSSDVIGTDRPLSPDEISTMVLDQSMFTPNDYDVKKWAIRPSAKFLRYAKACGAEFRRPDEGFTAAMARHCASVIMANYANRELVVMKKVNKFLERLRRDMGNTQWRARSAVAASRKIALRKAENDKLYKGLI